MKTLPIFGLDTDIAYCEAKGLSQVFNTYAQHYSREYILEGGIGFNSSSGAIYLALENGITLTSFFGRETEFVVFHQETDEEIFFETYEQAEKYLGIQ